MIKLFMLIDYTEVIDNFSFTHKTWIADHAFMFTDRTDVTENVFHVDRLKALLIRLYMFTA